MPALVLEVDHLTRYDYSQPVAQAQHLAVLQPVDDDRQTLLSFDLLIEPMPDIVDRLIDSHDREREAPRAWRTRLDAHGNRLFGFSLSTPHDHLRVQARSRVRLQARSPEGPWARPEATPGCAEVAQALRYQPLQPWQPAVEFAQPSPYVPRLPALLALARSAFTPDQPVLMAALSLMHRIHRDFRYESRSTDIDTPLGAILEHRRGVCQDFAHVMIGALRAVGLAARYVSGYLLTRPPEGQPPLVGADASHAWVQVWCPDAAGSAQGHWVDLDPTNDLIPDQAHVRLAVGRDFGDVTPLRGVIRGGGQHRLTVGVTTREIADTDDSAR